VLALLGDVEVSLIIDWKDCNWDTESRCGLRIALLRIREQTGEKKCTPSFPACQSAFGVCLSGSSTGCLPQSNLWKIMNIYKMLINAGT